MSTFTLAHDYVQVNCGAKEHGGCGLDFAMTRRFYDQTKRNKETWYCPMGHPRVWTGDTTEQKLKKAEAREQHLEDQLRAAVAEGEAIRSVLVRDRARFANGVCPCCNRSFPALTRHMATQHPEYDPKALRQRDDGFRCSCGRSFETWHGLRIHQGCARSDGWDDPDATRWQSHLTIVGT